MSDDRFLLKYSNWDWVPVIEAVVHLGLVIAWLFAFPNQSWLTFIVLGLIYALSISWSLNSISHNFIHNAYFKSETLNYLFSLLLSLTIVFSQAMYHFVHTRHHSGNSDVPDAHGDTVDHISIYMYGKDGKPENVWSYVFMNYFRDDPREFLKLMQDKYASKARQARFEIAALVVFYGLFALYNWKFVVCMAPFHYLGHCAAALNGYYEHLGADPEKPIAWGVSSYNKLYNWTWMNNGYHAEHHYRPKHHWTKMPELHAAIAEQQKREGVRVIAPPHQFGFLDSLFAREGVNRVS